MARRSPAALAVVLLVALLATACGGDDAAPASTGPSDTAAVGDGGAFPVTVAADNGDVTIEARPTAIVSLSPSLTEMLFAIGAGPQVVAVDDQSNHPPEAPTTDLSGFTPNVEAIAGYDPDLVVVSSDADGLVASLDALGIPVLLYDAPEVVEGAYDQIAGLGIATGNEDGAAAVTAGMRARIDELLAQVPVFEVAPSVYHELDPTYYSVTSATFIGDVYRMAGVDNIADGAGDGSDYPQLSAEYILAEDPDFVFLADARCCGQDTAAVAARPGWGQLTAVRTGGVVVLDDDIASRWGPRVVDLLAAVVGAVSGASQPEPEPEPEPEPAS
ncbi:MAG: ABC transporter substrate-binding protein [Acidimicrobiales bacterium]|nr:ABC transporter substrate-binding protein [Acidimicrobiales bacterium]